jgi:hypothetical protein
MTTRLRRLAYALEFLVAVIAIFTAWSEVGGQNALDLMHWAWKLGLGLAMAGAVVAYTDALVTEPSTWSPRAARRLTALLLLGIIMGAVTYYYALQADESGDEGTGGSSRDMSWRSQPKSAPIAGRGSASREG